MPKAVSLDPDVLDILMPMHALVSPDGIVRHAGPTLAKVHPGRTLAGVPFFELFELRRPRMRADIVEICKRAGAKVYLRLRDPARTPVIGAAMCAADGGSVLVNLSFGIAAVDAVARYDLAGSDFAATDLTLELLYLVEANAASMEEARKSGERLAGDRTVARAEAMSDTLTGLHNRRALDQALNRLIAKQVPFSMMNLDLDFFKAVNDTLGHAAGDLVLKTVARTIVEETRDDDIVSRVGGDEFVIIFNRLVDDTRLAALAGRLIRRLEEPVPYGTREARISASIGITRSDLYPRPDAAQMLHDADLALYESKRHGRARYSLFRPA